MPLNIPDYANPIDPPHPFTNAFGWVAGAAFDFDTLRARFRVNIHPSAEAAAAQGVRPAVVLSLGTGEDVDSLADLVAADAELAALLVAIKAKVEAILTTAPQLPGSTVI